MSISQSKKRLALSIIDFLSTSLKDGTLTADDAESIEIAKSCIAESFKVDPSDKKAIQDAVGGQSLMAIYGVYEKLKGKSTASTTGPSSAEEARPSTPATAAPDAANPTPPGKPNPEAEALKSRGNGAMARKDYAAAIDSYTEALELAPLNPIYLSNRAAAYSASGKHSEAAADAEMAVAADPKYVKAWSRLGLAKFAMGDAHGSMEAYQKGIEYEGGGGSEAMKKGLETAKAKVKELEEEGEATAGPEVDDAARSPGSGAGGMPDLAGLASMLGGGGGGGGGMPDLGSLMSNPMFASMAQNVMSNPDMMNNIMNNPRIRDMANQFGGGGGGGQGGGPDLSSIMSDPNIAEMARNLMGGGAGRGAGAGRGGS